MRSSRPSANSHLSRGAARTPIVEGGPATRERLALAPRAAAWPLARWSLSLSGSDNGPSGSGLEGIAPLHERSSKVKRSVRARTMSFGCCLDPPQLRQQLARGSKRLRGKFPASTVARAGEPPAVDLSSPPGHPLGAVKPRERGADHERAAAGPQTHSVDQHRDKPQQTRSNNNPSARRRTRQTPCKWPPSQTRRQSLHTREIAGSSPAVPITKTFRSPYSRTRSVSRGIGFSRGLTSRDYSPGSLVPTDIDERFQRLEHRPKARR
jgi:hypothetical protein